MATFLELCQEVARNSGVVGSTISSVTNQTGTPAKIVYWVRDAWRWLQVYRNDWTWMRNTWQATASIGVDQYAASDLAITDFDRFVTDRPEYSPLSCYDVTIGTTDTAKIRQIPWESWRSWYDLRDPADSRPLVYAISHLDKLCLGPAPDKAYVLRGEYVRTPQIFSANTDTPTGLRPQFHDIIWLQALVRLGMFDEAVMTMQTAQASIEERIQRLLSYEPEVTRYGGKVA